MNFLLHHHLASRDLGAPAAAAGAMLPDLWRMADRRVFARADVESAREDADVRDVLAGIAHHAAADKWFHAAPVFTDGERAAREALRPTGAPRIGLFAHITWEMCLDGALLRRVGLDAALDALRRAIAAARPAHRRAAELHHFARVARTGDERRAFDARTDRILDELARGPWIDGYRTGDGVAARLEGVRARLGFAAFAPTERAAVACAVDVLADRADDAVDRIVTRRPP